MPYRVEYRHVGSDKVVSLGHYSTRSEACGVMRREADRFAYGLGATLMDATECSVSAILGTIDCPNSLYWGREFRVRGSNGVRRCRRNLA